MGLVRLLRPALVRCKGQKYNLAGSFGTSRISAGPELFGPSEASGLLLASNDVQALDDGVG